MEFVETDREEPLTEVLAMDSHFSVMISSKLRNEINPMTHIIMCHELP